MAPPRLGYRQPSRSPREPDAAAIERHDGGGPAVLPSPRGLGWEAGARLLATANATVERLSGCCGLAGNFGVEKGHYDASPPSHLTPAADGEVAPATPSVARARAAAGRAIGCFGLTEPDFGSDPAGMRTTARRDGSDWILSGAKMWITNG